MAFREKLRFHTASAKSSQSARFHKADILIIYLSVKMNHLNRAALIIRPKDKYLDFCDIPKPRARDDCYVVLVPDVEGEEDQMRYLGQKNRFSRLFQHIMEASGKRKSSFPDTSSFKTFLDWFSLECHGVIYDLGVDDLPECPYKNVMRSLNRSLFVVRPKEPFLDYCGSPKEQTECDRYVALIPNLPCRENCLSYLGSNGRFSELFSEMLNYWNKDLTSHPDTGSFDIFQKWFALEYHGVIFDLADDYFPVGPAKFDLYYRDGTPNWYIGSSGMMNGSDFKFIKNHPAYPSFARGFSNQEEEE